MLFKAKGLFLVLLYTSSYNFWQSNMNCYWIIRKDYFSSPLTVALEHSRHQLIGNEYSPTLFIWHCLQQLFMFSSMKSLASGRNPSKDRQMASAVTPSLYWSIYGNCLKLMLDEGAGVLVHCLVKLSSLPLKLPPSVGLLLHHQPSIIPPLVPFFNEFSVSI